MPSVSIERATRGSRSMFCPLRLRGRCAQTISSPSSPTHTQLSWGEPSGLSVTRCARASDCRTARALSGRADTAGLSLRERHPARRDRRGLDDRRRRLAEGEEPVDHLLEVPDVADVQLHEEAVLAGDAVTLDDLGALARHLRDLGELAPR